MVKITGMHPASGSRGTVVTLTVEGLPPDTPVADLDARMGNRSVEHLRRESDTTIVVTVPEDAETAPITLRVDGGADAVSPRAFTVVGGGVEPRIREIAPASVAPGALVTVRGSALDALQAIAVGTRHVQETITHIGPTELQFRVPQGVPPGTYDLFGLTRGRGRIRSPSRIEVAGPQAGPSPGGELRPALTPAQQAVADVWYNLQSWVKSDLLQTAKGTSVGEVTFAKEVGVCYLLNGPEPGAANWIDDGMGTMILKSLKISQFDSTTWQAAEFPDATHAILSVGVKNLVVSGRYGFTQPCADYGTCNNKIDSTTASGSGGVSQMVASGTIKYQMKIDASGAITLAIVSATVDGDVDISVSPDGSANGFLDALYRFFYGDAEKFAMRSAMESAFTTAQFSANLVSIINAKLDPSLCAASSELDGVYRIWLILFDGRQRLAGGKVELRNGYVQGTDIGNRLYSGGCSVDHTGQMLVLDGTVAIPVTQGGMTQVPLRLSVPLTALKGGSARIKLPFNPTPGDPSGNLVEISCERLSSASPDERHEDRS